MAIRSNAKNNVRGRIRGLQQIALQSDSDPYDNRFRQTFDPIFQLIKTVYRISLSIRPLQTRVFLSHHWAKLGKLTFSGHQELPMNHILLESLF